MSSPLLAPLAQAAPRGQATPAQVGKNAEAAQQFEGMLMTNLFQQLRKSVDHSNLFGGSGSAQSTYEYMLDQAVVTHAMAGGRTWGLAERLQSSPSLNSSTKRTSNEQDLISRSALPIPSL